MSELSCFQRCTTAMASSPALPSTASLFSNRPGAISVSTVSTSALSNPPNIKKWPEISRNIQKYPLLMYPKTPNVPKNPSICLNIPKYPEISPSIEKYTLLMHPKTSNIPQNRSRIPQKPPYIPKYPKISLNIPKYLKVSLNNAPNMRKYF